MTMDWKCSGCGKPSPGRARSCECPTNVVYQDDGKNAWKLEAGAPKTVEHCHDLIGRLYENPSSPLRAEDVDLIKTALRQHVERLS